jgi:2-isopropylmalate synthase
MFEYLINGTKGANDVVWSTHCHNDLGLATANTLEGIRGGARQVEVTVNGIGERAGNTAIEEIAMALKTRPLMYEGVYTDLDVSGITRASRMVSAFTGIMVQPNKAIVGANAFAHEAEIGRAHV